MGAASRPLKLTPLHSPLSLCLRQLLFSVNSMIAWLMRTDVAIRQIEKLAFDWIKMDCTGGKCYGLLAVSPTPLSLS